MKNETCNRCRLKYSLIECDNCQETFCSECDSYIHSIISKKDHIRKMIYSESTHDTISKLNSNYEPKNFPFEFSQYNAYNTNMKNNNIDFPYKNTLFEEFKNDENSQRINYRQTFNSFGDINEDFDNFNEMKNNESKYNKNISGYYINEIKNVYSTEKNELILKINELSKELVDTKTNLGEHIDYLNNQIIDIEKKHKEEISELILKYSEDFKINSLEKDTRIKQLESELNYEKEKNENLQKKLNEYEQIIKSNKNDIKKLSEEKAFIDNAKKENEERLKEKISNIDKTHNEEIINLKKTYQNELNKMKTELDNNKLNYMKMTEESKENMNKIITERKKEKLVYSNEMNKLKEDITNKISENQKLNIAIKDLKKNNQKLNEKVSKMNDEINYKEMEKKRYVK